MTAAGSDCPSGKQQFTKAGAQERRALWRRRGDRNMRVYHCDHCELYHVGHRRRADKKRQMAR